MSKLVEQMSKGYYNFCPSEETWAPSVNLYEVEKAYLVCVDLAGVDKDKIELTVHENRLRLRGMRAVPVHPDFSDPEAGAKKIRVHLMEIDNGSFVREVELPEDIDQDKISAQYISGMLWVEIPKK
jgi:HSP20 family protein